VAHSDRAPTPEDGTTQTAAAGLPPNAPAQWGEFRIVAELGHGGFGRVYRAFDAGLAKDIALKIVRPADPARIPAVLREGQMLARIRHPNVVTVHAVRQVGDEIGFVMELVEGESLADRVRRDGRLGADEAVSIGQTLCQALAAVHAAGLLHRDIKARNVMRDSRGQIILMDLGAGRELATSGPRDDLTGTPPYLAPELFSGHDASPASDIYSLGVLLYYLVTGAHPVEGATAFDIAMAHRSGARRLLVDRRPDLPPDFIRVVERALSDRTRRYQTAGELLEDLNAIATRQPVPGPAGRVVAASRWPARLAWWAAGAAGAVAAIVVLGFLATRAYDSAFGLGRFADDSFTTSLRVGLRSLVPPAVWVTLVLVSWLVVKTIWQTTQSAMPPLQRFARRVHSSVSSAITGRTPRDRNTLARWLLLAQAAVVVIVLVVYRRELYALTIPFDRANPSVWQVLFYDSDRLGPVNDYQRLLPIAAAAMGIAWRRLIKSAGGVVALDRPVVIAGVAIIGLLVLGVSVPFRVFYEANRGLPRYEVDRERCYEVGRRADDVRLFCPDVVPGPNQFRNKNVKADNPQIQQPLPALSPYAPAPKAP